MKPFSDSGKFQRNDQLRDDQLRDDQTQQHIWLGATKRIAACLISEIQVTEENGNKEWVFQSKKYNVIDSELVNSLRCFGYTTNLSAGVCNEFKPYVLWSMEYGVVMAKHVQWDRGQAMFNENTKHG
ncbi:Uncharacterized protein Rs2_17614 [Raphanus sativus]|nr:Uncharacterized protein Rs2_17614 [Raphanus sativus]